MRTLILALTIVGLAACEKADVADPSPSGGADLSDAGPSGATDGAVDAGAADAGAPDGGSADASS